MFCHVLSSAKILTGSNFTFQYHRATCLQILTPKTYDEHPRQFDIGVPPGKILRTNTTYYVY